MYTVFPNNRGISARSLVITNNPGVAHMRGISILLNLIAPSPWLILTNLSRTSQSNIGLDIVRTGDTQETSLTPLQMLPILIFQGTNHPS